MVLQVPNLDDLDFEKLIEEARGFIPRYASDWTDHNVHDPGVTLLELAAWLVDQQIYRVGFVSDQHVKSFAALLGVYPRSATPARGLLWPHDDVNYDIEPTGSVNLDAGTKVTCVEQPELPFELAASVYISSARFAQKDEKEDSSRFIITATNKSRNVAPNLKNFRGESGIIKLVFDRPLVTSNEVDSSNPISIGIKLESNVKILSLDNSPGGRLVVDYRIENGRGPWRRATIVEDNTYALNQTGAVLLNLPRDQQYPKIDQGASSLRLYVKERINLLTPRIKSVALNVLPVVQREMISQSVIGRSSGLPDQTFFLNLESLPEGEKITVEVSENERFNKWHHTDDLISSGPQDRVFNLFPENNEIRFGNGINGRIPPLGAQIQHQEYSLTAGAVGNFRSGLHWVVRGIPIQPGHSSYGVNRAAFYAGADSWDMQRLIAKTRHAALKRNVMLTNSELMDAAKLLQGMGVERANVLVGFDPVLPGKDVNNTRALVITPKRSAQQNPLTPVPRRYLTAIEQALKPRRVLGERLFILTPRRIPVSIEALLLIKDGIDGKTVIMEANARLNARLSDIKVENDVNIEPWPIGRDVTRQEIKALLATIDGVVAVTQCRLEHQGSNLENDDLLLKPDEIAIGINFEINVVSNLETQR